MSKAKIVQQEDADRLFIYLNLISPVPENERRELAGFFSMKSLKEKEFFLRAGDRAELVGFILSGAVREYFVNDKGDEFNKSFNFKNEFTGSYYDLLNKNDSIAYIQALTDTRLLVAPFDQMLKFYERNMHWQRLGRKFAEALFMKKAKREYEFVTLSAEERYASFLKKYPEVSEKIAQYHIASYLGITPVALSRIRKRIKKRDPINPG
ncbi:MAG: Crp/Fnr family transcriptional regulator [Leptospira sp.]|nr:Crp/Fnr family transcriptional regulator [Leptospira sp.]